MITDPDVFWDNFLNPAFNMTDYHSVFGRVEGMDILIELQIVQTILLVCILFYSIRRRRIS